MPGDILQHAASQAVFLSMLISIGVIALRLKIRWKWILPIPALAFAGKIILLLGVDGHFGDWVPGRHNWEGKLIAIGFWLTVIALVFKHRPAFIGLTLKQNGPFPRAAWGLAIFSATAWALACAVQFPGVRSAPLPDILFQLTMPSLDEELWYRGILLALLLEGFTPKGTQKPPISATILVVLITAVSFWGAHAIHMTDNGHLAFNVWGPIDTLGFGLVWAVVRIGTGSLMLPILLHTWTNTAGFLL